MWYRHRKKKHTVNILYSTSTCAEGKSPVDLFTHSFSPKIALIQAYPSIFPSWWNCAICNSCALQKYVEIRWSSLEFLQTVCVTYSLSWTTNSWWDCAIYRPLHALLSKLSCVIVPSITVTLSRNEEIFCGISAYTWHFHWSEPRIVDTWPLMMGLRHL